MKWPSQQLYDGRLKAAPSVEKHLLKDLPGVKPTEETALPLLLIDTAGCDVYEMQVEEEVSKGNEGEADIVAAHVCTLVDAGVSPSDIAVIAPYNLQASQFSLVGFHFRFDKMFHQRSTVMENGGRNKKHLICQTGASQHHGNAANLEDKRK